MGSQADKDIERLFFKRLPKLVDIRRFVVAWLLLFVLLIGGVFIQTRQLSGLYEAEGPIPGGTFTEGILGNFTNANPLFATGAVDSSVSHLLFSGLMRYDARNRLSPDIATGYSVDKTGTTYLVKLRDDIMWHDGQKLTAEDVVFTYKTIQNPDAKSPLFSSWRGINVKAVDPYTVSFTLPNALTAFPHSLTNGIVPKHLLDGIDVAQLRSVRFNTVAPIGSGPFQWETIEVTGTSPEDRQEKIGLLPYADFYRGEPKLNRFIIRTYRDESDAIKALKNQEVNAIAGLETRPDDFAVDELYDYNVPLTGQVMAFFNNSHTPLNDIKVRRALVQAIDHGDLLASIGFPVIPVKSPLLRSHVGYNESLLQYESDLKKANALLDAAGWKKAEDGIRKKGDTRLSLRLYSQATSEYTHVSRELQSRWREVGVDVQVFLQSAADLQQVTIAQHNYDILLYGISVGNDPDVFAYWHSTQAAVSTGGSLNFSEYKSEEADNALEAGRTREGDKLRAVKYKPFLEAWRKDAPALALYQPRVLYVTRTPIANFEPSRFNAAFDRYANVENWMIRTGTYIKE